MTPLALHRTHADWGAQFTDLAGMEAVARYGELDGEYAAFRSSAGILDLSFRGRLCLTGADRVRFLHGQVTNDVSGLSLGQGCYAALITAKGKMVSDLNIYRLENELLLDFEPGLEEVVRPRLEQYIIADDAQVVGVSGEYGLMSVQGPEAARLMDRLQLTPQLPTARRSFARSQDEALGEIYVMNCPRLGSSGFDLFVPTTNLAELANRLREAAPAIQAGFCGWEAFEIARVEEGIPRFGADMDGSILPPEAGLEKEAISYTKGCYIGQEVISRVRAYGQVAKTLRRLALPGADGPLPKKGDKLRKETKEVGFITSAVQVPGSGARLALGYVRREVNVPGAELTVSMESGETIARLLQLQGL